MSLAYAGKTSASPLSQAREADSKNEIAARRETSASHLLSEPFNFKVGSLDITLKAHGFMRCLPTDPLIPMYSFSIAKHNRNVGAVNIAEYEIVKLLAIARKVANPNNMEEGAYDL